MRSALVAVLVASACGGAQKREAQEEAESFDCKDRVVSYIATGHISAEELGVQMDCAQAGPRIKRWKVDKQGNRLEDARSLPPSEFEAVWREIDGTGWPNLQDCASSGEKTDPTFVFDIKDNQNQASFQCQARAMPYPYNGIVDPLDVAAAQGRGELGGTE